MRSGYSIASVNPPIYPHLRGAGIRTLVYDTEAQALSGGRNIRFDTSWLPSAAPDVARKSNQYRSSGDALTIFFTSGTTGIPKKIVLTPQAWQDRFLFSSSTTFGDFEKALIAPGLASAYGFTRACEILYAGKTACFAPDTQQMLSLVTRFNIDLIIASAQQALALADLQVKGHFHVASLKAVKIGGGVVSKEGIQRLRNQLCRNVIIYYGSTEAGTAAIARYDTIADIPGAVGVVLPEVAIETVDEAGNQLPPGAEGIIRLRTPLYLKNLEHERAGEKPDPNSLWFYPGDIGRITEDGVLCLVGRSTDVINRGGAKVSAARIEEVLRALPEIKDAAACGVEGPSGLEEVWVAIVPQGPVEIAKINQQMQGNGDIGIPADEVFVVEEIPRGELGKVQKYRLKELMHSRKRQT
jgi:acyl-coenzyme A synthetase/AMP-(fatty) acid ligase